MSSFGPIFRQLQSAADDYPAAYRSPHTAAHSTRAAAPVWLPSSPPFMGRRTLKAEGSLQALDREGPLLTHNVRALRRHSLLALHHAHSPAVVAALPSHITQLVLLCRAAAILRS